jgi:hypothetical protein
MALYDRAWIDDLQLVAVLDDRHFVVRRDGDHREDGARRLPAFRASASVIVSDLALDSNFDRPRRTKADQCSSGEVRVRRLHACINGGMKIFCFRHRFLLVF